MLKIMSIAGARPNFMKLASIASAVNAYNEKVGARRLEHIIVHTGQHYDKKMSKSFFIDLGIPEPDCNLGVGSGTHAAQTAKIMERVEPVLLEKRPDVLLVVGDVNSTIACTLVASKIVYPGEGRRRPIIVHVEAGLRSRDKDMPEEINRILTDALSDLLFVTEPSGVENLKKEGVEAAKIHMVGNVMIDTLKNHLGKAQKSQIRQELNVESQYALVTLHRPSNVDNKEILEGLVGAIVSMCSDVQIVFPVHPRTRQRLQQFDLWPILTQTENLITTDPLGYLDFLHLIKHAVVVVTDSGGIQEETTYLGIPCVTLRKNTERPITVSAGTNYLIGTDVALIRRTVGNILHGNGKKAEVPDLWDGHAGERIVEIVIGAASQQNIL